MKRELLIILSLLMATVFCSAQIREKENVKIEIPGTPVIMMNFYDAEMLSPKGEKVPSEKYKIDSVSVKIISPKVTEEITTGDDYFAYTATKFKAKKLMFIVSRKGYKTLEEEWKVTSLNPTLDIYLTKEE